RGRSTWRAPPRALRRCSPSARPSDGATSWGSVPRSWTSCPRSSPCSSSPSAAPCACTKKGRSPRFRSAVSPLAKLVEAALFASPRRLSPAALETLAIIAYRQPVGRSEVDEIRGVDSGAVIDKLAERGLVEVVTRGEGLGRPLLYGTTPQFLEILGLKDLDELPRLEELSVALRPPAPAEPA